MKVYVLIEVHEYPDVDGASEIIGVYSTRELAEKDAEEIRWRIRDELDTYGDPAMEAVIEEYELRGVES